MRRFWQYILALWDINNNVSFKTFVFRVFFWFINYLILIILYPWELLVSSEFEKESLFIIKHVIDSRAWMMKDFDKFEEFLLDILIIWR